jgi:hypothetical protein
MNYDHERHLVDVDVEEWEIARGDSILETRGLGPCIGIAAYDPVTRTGHMLHTANPHAAPMVLDEFFGSIAETAHDPERVIFYVRGGHPCQIEGCEDSTETARQVTLDRLKAFGRSAMSADVEWTENPEGVVDMRLDTWTGEFVSEATTVSALHELYYS